VFCTSPKIAAQLFYTYLKIRSLCAVLERKKNTALLDNNEHVPCIFVQVDIVYNFCISHLPKAYVAATAGELFMVQDR
jgi:hypothetical protein